MNKINFVNGKTPLNAANLNKMQDNIEKAIGELAIETVTNENGIALKFSDGKMVTYQEIYYDLPCTESWGSLYCTLPQALPNFPVAFIERPIVIKDVEPYSFDVWLTGVGISTNIAPASYYLLRPTSADKVEGRVCVFAIGKWK